MNERIQQFAEQARTSVPAGLDTVEWIERYNRIFAELIVQECISVIYKEEKLPEGFIMPKSAMTLEHALKQHFGSKESRRKKFEKAIKEAFENGVDLSGRETP